MSATAAQPPSRQGGSDQNQGGGEAEVEGANRRGKAITTCVNCGKDSHDLHLCVHCSQSQCFNCRWELQFHPFWFFQTCFSNEFCELNVWGREQNTDCARLPGSKLSKKTPVLFYLNEFFSQFSGPFYAAKWVSSKFFKKWAENKKSKIYRVGVLTVLTVFKTCF